MSGHLYGRCFISSQTNNVLILDLFLSNTEKCLMTDMDIIYQSSFIYNLRKESPVRLVIAALMKVILYN